MLRETFPEAFREGRIDVEALTRSLGEWVDPGPERFGLTWPGKAECMRIIQEPSVGTLVPMPEESVNWDTTQNVIIEGENLEVLKLLQKAYYGKVKMIYIDPPYNTGKEFIYPDNFKEGLADYLKYSGQVDDAGFKVSANTDTDGRYHSKWLSMMYPRLFLARNLLRDDGVIFVSIDDHEVHNLRAIMNEIFGEENFVANIVWQKVYSPKNTAKYFSEDHDHIVMFARSITHWAPGLIPRDQDATDRYSNPDNDIRGPWKSADLSARNFYGQGTYAIESPSGRTVPGPPAGRYWAVSRTRFDELAADGRIWWGSDGKASPSVKRFLSEVRDGIVPQTLWKYQDVGHTQEGKKQLLDLLSFSSSDTVFDTPKPSRLIERMLQVATNGSSDDIVLDFFAGSGTTGEAIMKANATDAGNRQFILIQLPEKTADPNYATIANITRSRVRAASARLAEVGKSSSSTDGYRSYRLSRSNFLNWNPTSTTESVSIQLEMAVENTPNEGSGLAVASELLLKAGYGLSETLHATELASGSDCYTVDDTLVLYLGHSLTTGDMEELVTLSPSMIVILDSAFCSDDNLKVNALQTVRAHNQREGSDITLRVV